jgi:release factor glutamine methyltransferase
MRCAWPENASASVPDVAAVGSAHLAEELDGAAALLARSGVGEPRREAARLWAAVSGTSLGETWRRRELPAPVETVARFRRAVARRATGVPFAYAAGSVAFRTLELAIDHRALIPRPETEGLVELVLQWSREGARGGVVADIGTGSGCIALALAVEGPFERVIATDSSDAAAALARENVARIAPSVPVEVRVGDLVAPIAGTSCRVIVSNPPYLTEPEWTDLDPAVRDHEPADALRSGPDGLAATRRLFAGARAVLEPGGLLALEIDERRAAAVRRLAMAAGWRVSIHQDLFGRPRYALAV